MNYIFDTEFYEDGHRKPIELISLGMVTLEDDRELYLENSDVCLLDLSPWLKENVVPHLRWKDSAGRLGRDGSSDEGYWLKQYGDIGPEVLRFIGDDLTPRFWAYFADYDWVVFCQLFGSMIALPKTFPMFCRDIKQEMKRMGVERQVYSNKDPSHSALGDARKAKEMLQNLIKNGMELF